jgi:DUF4097 and DUF4098 domain-containing protein YvlB
MSNEDDLVARAREIAERAQRLADDATDSDELRAELDRLDQELANLDAEQRRLDAEMADRTSSESPAGDKDEPSRGWDDLVSGLMALGERLGDIGSRFRWRSSDTIARSVPVEGPTPVLVESRAGPIDIRAGDTDSVHVVAERFAPTTGALEEIEVTTQLEDGRVVVRCDWTPGHRGRWVRLTVQVPPTSPVTASTRGGAIKVIDTAGSSSVTTVGGSLRVEGTAGGVEAQTAGGSITVSRHDGAVEASTSGGSIRLSGRLLEHVHARTMGGSIIVEGIEGAACEVTTAGGSIKVRGRIIGDSSVKTSGGSIAITLPGDSNLTVDAKATSARSDFPELEGRHGRLQGVLGDGTDCTLKVRTSGGALSVDKS